MSNKLSVRVQIGSETRLLSATKGSNLRDVLLANNIKSFSCLFEYSDHCEGTGLCGNCGVWIETQQTATAIKKKATAFLACNVILLESINISLINNWIGVLKK